MTKTSRALTLIALLTTCGATASDNVTGKPSSASDKYRMGHSAGCLAGIELAQTGRLMVKSDPFDKEYVSGWNAGKRECAATYRKLRDAVT